MNLPQRKRLERFIRQKAVENASDPTSRKVAWSFHAVNKLRLERLLRQEVERALVTAEIIEEYPQLTRRLKDCLILGFTSDKQPIHAVVGIDEANDRIFMITIYRPDTERWENDWKTRKRN
jgi:hypothetical protein